MADYVKYDLWLGSFEGENFKWKKLKSFNDWSKAYKEYKSFVNEQFRYSDKELFEVWHSTRLDIELKQEDKLLNWVGIYLRKKDGDDDEDSVEDSLTNDDKELYDKQQELLDKGLVDIGPRKSKK